MNERCCGVIRRLSGQHATRLKHGSKSYTSTNGETDDMAWTEIREHMFGDDWTNQANSTVALILASVTAYITIGEQIGGCSGSPRKSLQTIAVGGASI
jgi:hypothetical protein